MNDCCECGHDDGVYGDDAHDCEGGDGDHGSECFHGDDAHDCEGGDGDHGSECFHGDGVHDHDDYNNTKSY